MRAARIASSVVLALIVLVLSGASVRTRAQNDRSRSQLRAVHGSVMDKDQNPIANGVVYLRDKKTNDVKTQISDAQGHFQFTGLDPNVDFEIHAQYKSRKSPRRTISSFDSRRDIEINLIIPN